MGKQIEMRIPKYPECWETCGNCGAGEVTIEQLLVAPGDRVERDQTVLVLETAKVGLDIPSPVDGVILSVHVTPGQAVEEGALVLTIEADS